MASFSRNQTLVEFQQLIAFVYGLTDDRYYSLWDLLIHQQRFATRALKGIRKGERQKTLTNLLIALSWLAAIANRLHIDLADEIWRRFPDRCSYCSQSPCCCQQTKPTKRAALTIEKKSPKLSVEQLQAMFKRIYPPGKRTLADAGMHFAEELGEVSEAIDNFLGRHEERQFTEIGVELADVISCVFGIANSADFDVALALESMYKRDCHICHQAPCVCSFTSIMSIET